VNFTFTDEQRLFARTFAELLDRERTPERLRSGDLRLWPHLLAMGVDQVAFTDLALLLEEAGRVALPDPIVEHTAVAVPALGKDPPGLVTTSFADAPLAPDADRAAAVLVQRDDGLFLVEHDRIALTRNRSLDPTRRLFGIQAEGGERIGGPAEAARAAERGWTGTAAVCLGLAQRMIDMAAAYARDRHQFGKPIGEFQLVKGMLADALLVLTFARPVVYRAAHSVEHGSGTCSTDASMAKAAASEAVLA
jgi:hypothetical protein